MRRLGDHPMTSSERQRRYLAKLARPSPAKAVSELTIQVDHLRRFPAQTASWLRQRLGHRATLAFCNALSKALADVPEEFDHGQ